MKKILVWIVVFFCSVCVYAQQDYTFERATDLDLRYLRIEDIAHLGGETYFVASNRQMFIDLYRVAPTHPQGAVLIKSFFTGGWLVVDRLTSFDNFLYFRATDSGALSAAQDVELWRSDGTSEGTIEIDLNPLGSSNPRHMTVLGDTLFFIATHEEQGVRLWHMERGDGVPQIITGDYAVSGSSGDGLYTHGSAAFFKAEDSAHGTKLYMIGKNQTDVTLVPFDSGNELASRLVSVHLITANRHGSVFFVTSRSGGTWTLWKTDGALTQKVALIPSSVTAIKAVGSAVYIRTSSGLYASDGTPDNMRMITPASITGWESTGDILYLLVGTTNRSLWKVSVGSDHVEILLSSAGGISELSGVGDRVFFVLNPYTTTERLWKSDGTVEGTVVITMPNISSPQTLHSVDGVLYFSAYESLYGRELWRYGTVPSEPQKLPVLIVPGIFGSWSEEMFCDSSGNVFEIEASLFLKSLETESKIISSDIPEQWTLDPITGTYDALRTRLQNDGYDVVDFPYDWRKSIDVLALELRIKIAEVKAQYNVNKVNIVAHSMGGLIARDYIQNFYGGDVGKLAMIGVPQQGSLDVYYVLDSHLK